jgi:hypothetical protein
MSDYPVEENKTKRANRSVSDQERDKKIYEYLLTLIDNDSENYNESRIAAQWGMSDNRMFVRRVIRSISTEVNSENDLIIPGITLNKLISILKSIDQYRQKKNKYVLDGKFPKVLTRSEKLKALHLYGKISFEERKDFLPEELDSQLLLEKLVEDITDPYKGLDSKKINDVCKYISECVSFESEDDDFPIQYNVANIILDSIQENAFEYLQHLKQDFRDALTRKIFLQVKNATQNIEYQNGSYEFRNFLDQEVMELRGNISSRDIQELALDFEKQKQEIEVRFSPKKFLQRLTKSIIENQILTEEFPVHMKHIEIQEIHQSIPQENNSKNHLFAYTVKVNFYLKNLNEEIIEFYEEVTGVGSPLSHTIAAINRALLWDIKSLKNYVPIAKQVTFNTEIVGSSNNGSIWGNYIVSLCKIENINFQKNSCLIEDLSHGDYCGFDTLEVYAKASFYARLRAIKKTGIFSGGILASKYIEELQTKIIQTNHLRTGEKLLHEYPFSLEAMKNYLTDNLLFGCYNINDDGFPIISSVKYLPWSLTEYEAHLSITEAYLIEGLFTIGKIYLDCIESHMINNNILINRIIIARYHLCYFRYYYLSDLGDGNANNHRMMSITRGNIHLNNAYLNLKEYVYTCNVIDELPYVNFYNFFTVMSELYAHKAKLSFFMSEYLHANNDRFDSITISIELFQKARIYAARSGNSSLYSIWSAYQAWCYLVAAYSTGNNDNKIKYIGDAEKVLTYGLKSYEKIGKRNYESIKLVSGKENIFISKNEFKIDYEKHGGVQIQGIPLIKEFDVKSKKSSILGYSSEDGSLTIDMSFLTSTLPGTEETLLFGTQSSILIFVSAMLQLCHNKHDNNTIVEELKSAEKKFCYSWSFANNGVQNFDVHEKIINRWNTLDTFQNTSSVQGLSLSGLYPHRLTHFADFGKIFFIVCEIILLSQLSYNQENERWKYIKILLADIRLGDLGSRKKYTEQEKFNGHLKNHFNAFNSYVNMFEIIVQRREVKKSLLEVRQEVLQDVSDIIRTGRGKKTIQI